MRPLHMHIHTHTHAHILAHTRDIQRYLYVECMLHTSRAAHLILMNRIHFVALAAPPPHRSPSLSKSVTVYQHAAPRGTYSECIKTYSTRGVRAWAQNEYGTRELPSRLARGSASRATRNHDFSPQKP